jgi:hypothetical protein
MARTAAITRITRNTEVAQPKIIGKLSGKPRPRTNQITVPRRIYNSDISDLLLRFNTRE